MTTRWRLSAAAEADIVGILAQSHEHFGDAARIRYQALVAAALRDISADPFGVGSHERVELGDGVRSWHLRLSGARVSDTQAIVRHPRHLLVYRVERGTVVVGRVLHDSMELERHLDADAWE